MGDEPQVHTMILAELRGLIAVVVVGILIAVLFSRIAAYGEDESVSAEAVVTSSSTSSSSSTTSTTAAPVVVDALEGIGILCDSATDYVEAIASDEINYPGKLPQLSEEFYAKVVDVAQAEVRAEYDAALRYYTEYNDLAEPHLYDGLTILISDQGERWGALVNGTPPGIAATQANVAFLCEGLELPDPPLMSPNEFKRLSDLAKKQRGS